MNFLMSVDPLDGGIHSLDQIPIEPHGGVDGKISDMVGSFCTLSPPSSSELIYSTFMSSKENGNRVIEAPPLRQTHIYKREQEREEEFEKLMLIEEASRLQSIPREFIISFRHMMQQLVPRTALIILTIHAMMLIPTLKVIKYSLKMSIVPFIYIGPILFILPYVLYYIWDNQIFASDTWPIRFLDNYLRNFIISEQKNSEVLLLQEEDRLKAIIWEEDQLNQRTSSNSTVSSRNNKSKDDNGVKSISKDAVQRLAYLRLLPKLDTNTLLSEILAVRSRMANVRRIGNELEIGMHEDIAGKQQSINASASVHEIVGSMSSLNINRSGRESTGNPIIAARHLMRELDSMAIGKEERAAILKELKILKRELDNK
jgi:hypothetical protein